jgi:hypothetical protein
MKPCYRGNDDCPDDCCLHLTAKNAPCGCAVHTPGGFRVREGCVSEGYAPPDPLENTQDIFNADGNGIWRRASKRLWARIQHACGRGCYSEDANNPYCDICGNSGR